METPRTHDGWGDFTQLMKDLGLTEWDLLDDDDPLKAERPDHG